MAIDVDAAAEGFAVDRAVRRALAVHTAGARGRDTVHVALGVALNCPGARALPGALNRTVVGASAARYRAST